MPRRAVVLVAVTVTSPDDVVLPDTATLRKIVGESTADAWVPVLNELLELDEYAAEYEVEVAVRDAYVEEVT